ncbi:MAG: hypothetical protein EPO52_00045 [Herbiconiux sp.]|uniref:hypothetical protein n=1 Tax=Herbiconiux sp. TaxID=1871186 RepID=UPI00122555B1|nr:hypothetical protein [Herbiconiux sp.]TAJ50254.1 MAG: hypothetical protein EPO52_00045 [Herbiconiux sp.]
MAATVIVALPSPAFADDGTFALEAPAGASSAWIEFEQAGLAPESLVVRARIDDSPWRALTLTQTTFGLHAALPIEEGRLQVTVVSAPGGSASSPDAAITVLDAADNVLASSSVRLRVPAASPAGGSSPQPAEVVPPAARAAGDVPGSSRSGWLAATGGPQAWGALLATAGMVVAGIIVLVSRARRSTIGA